MGIISLSRCAIGGLILGYALAVIVLFFLIGSPFGFGYVILGGILGFVGGKIVDQQAPDMEKGIGALLAFVLLIGMVWTNLGIYR